MELATPAALALALLAVPVLLLALRPRRSAVAAPAVGGLTGLPPTFRLRLARALPFTRAAAIVLLAIAAAGPRAGDAGAVVPGEGIDIALAIDISSSMSSGYLGGGATTRLEAVREVVREFIAGREDDRIGLVVFQREALALSPPTLDYASLDRLVADVNSGLIRDGTAVGAGLATALDLLRDSTAASRVAILLTDGQHNAQGVTPRDAADLARALNIRVYTIGVVDDRERGANAEVDAELLTTIAEDTGGRFYAVDDPATLAEVYEEIGNLETSAVGREQFERYDILAAWFVVPAVLLLAFEVLLRGAWLRRNPE